jgi:hypothetical protein
MNRTSAPTRRLGARKALTCMIVICREVEWHAAFLAGRIGGEAVSSMCDDQGYSAAEAAWSAPRVAEGPAVDPVRLPEVDEVRVTTMVDNIFDALLASAEGVTRASRGAGRTAAAQFAGGQAVAGCVPSTASPRWSPSKAATRAARCCSIPAPRRTRWR